MPLFDLSALKAQIDAILNPAAPPASISAGDMNSIETDNLDNLARFSSQPFTIIDGGDPSDGEISLNGNDMVDAGPWVLSISTKNEHGNDMLPILTSINAGAMIHIMDYTGRSGLFYVQSWTKSGLFYQFTVNGSPNNSNVPYAPAETQVAAVSFYNGMGDFVDVSALVTPDANSQWVAAGDDTTNVPLGRQSYHGPNFRKLELRGYLENINVLWQNGDQLLTLNSAFSAGFPTIKDILVLDAANNPIGAAQFIIQNTAVIYTGAASPILGTKLEVNLEYIKSA